MPCSSCVAAFREKVLKATPLPRPEEILSFLSKTFSLRNNAERINAVLKEHFVEARVARDIYVQDLVNAVSEHDGPFIERAVEVAERSPE